MLVVVIASVLLVTVGGFTGSGGNDGGSYLVERPDVGPGEKAIMEYEAETGIDVYQP